MGESGAGNTSKFLWLLLICVLGQSAATGQSKPVADALTHALHGTQATAVVLDLRTGEGLASAGVARRGAPGSVIKPLLLEYALEHGVVRAETEVYCRRELHVGARSLPCTHPASLPVFTAESALAESCNTWFAEMGRRFTGLGLEAALRGTGLPHTSMETAGVEQRQLAVLGLSGVTASPIELARGYRQFMEQMPPDGPVARGLRASVDYGMANPAHVQGMVILGKTGTASEPGEAWTHGWFAGVLPGRLVVVVYVPHGDGGTAARLARQFFAALPHEAKAR
jgi:cell division protein FtsI/penicillin-binding protein 2